MTEYIEKDVVINDIGELFTICYETLPNEYGHHFIVEEELQTHLNFVRNLPTADVKPVIRGKWINTYIQGIHHYRCTNCGEYIEAIWTANFDYNFCPNCGADMRGGENA